MTQPVDDWYRPEIPRKELKALKARGDGKGLANFGLWLACLAGSGYLEVGPGGRLDVEARGEGHRQAGLL